MGIFLVTRNEPLLGVAMGRARRDVGIMRAGTRRRPPTRKHWQEQTASSDDLLLLPDQTNSVHLRPRAWTVARQVNQWSYFVLFEHYTITDHMWPLRDTCTIDLWFLNPLRLSKLQKCRFLRYMKIISCPSWQQHHTGFISSVVMSLQHHHLQFLIANRSSSCSFSSIISTAQLPLNTHKIHSMYTGKSK